MQLHAACLCRIRPGLSGAKDVDVRRQVGIEPLGLTHLMPPRTWLRFGTLEAGRSAAGLVREKEWSRETLLDPEATQSRFLVMAS